MLISASCGRHSEYCFSSCPFSLARQSSWQLDSAWHASRSGSSAAMLFLGSRSIFSSFSSIPSQSMAREYRSCSPLCCRTRSWPFILSTTFSVGKAILSFTLSFVFWVLVWQSCFGRLHIGFGFWGLAATRAWVHKEIMFRRMTADAISQRNRQFKADAGLREHYGTALLGGVFGRRKGFSRRSATLSVLFLS